MNFQEKQVWCHAAGSVLALAILLPPVGVQDGDEQLRRETLPHIQHVREQEEQLQSELQKKQGKRDRPWPDATPVYGRAKMWRDAKFSLSYAESGLWYEARELMLAVDEHLVKSDGLDDAGSIRARLFLSETYWWLGEPDEAVRLQEELLAACQKSLGEDNTQTLNVSDRLGASFWQQDKFHQARELAQKAVDGFQKMYPTFHVDKSRALTNLGRCCGKLADFDQAVELHVEALEGLESAERKAEGQYGDQILEVMENLAMARHDRQRYSKAQLDDLQEAQRLQSEVLKIHKEKLGKEHPKSLWASCNLARIEASIGALEEAEHMMRKNLPAAERTMGTDHIGTLMGKAYLGQVLTLAGELDEAEALLSGVVKSHRARDGQQMHPGHLVAAAFLLECYRRQHRYRAADAMEGRVLGGIKGMFGEGSPWEKYFVGHYMADTDEVISEDA